MKDTLLKSIRLSLILGCFWAAPVVAQEAIQTNPHNAKYQLDTKGKVLRPSDTMALYVTGLKDGLPHERGAYWWEITYQDGHLIHLNSPPKTQKNIHYVRYCINDYERATSSLGTGTLIKQGPLDTVTLVYPTFWTGQNWLLESELPQKAPNTYKQLMAKATLEHRAIINLRNWRQLEVGITKIQAKIAEIQSELKPPGLSLKQRRYLKKRLEHYQNQLLHHYKGRNLTHKNTAVPITMVRAYRFSKEIQNVQQDIVRLEKDINWLDTEIPQHQGLEQYKLELERKQKQAELALVQQMLPKLHAMHKEFKQKNWILDY